MNNKPKYTIFKNAMYAVEGLIYAIKTETSFKLELFLGLFIVIAIVFIPIELSYKLILLISLFIIFIAELLNSSVENIVDLVTKEIHPLAKSAKDLGATAVLFSVVLHIICWLFILIYKL